MRVRILPDVDKYFQIRESMKDQDKVKMLFLIQNVNVFAWSPYEVSGVHMRCLGWISNSLSIGLT